MHHPTFAERQKAKHAGVAELVDAPDLGSGAARRGGSSPSTRTSTSSDRLGRNLPPACKEHFMAQIEKKELSPQEWEVHLSVEPKDYLPSLKEELKKLKGQVSFRGFRKGKTPLSFLRRTLGSNVLPNLIVKIINENIDKLLEENQREMLYPSLPLEPKSPQDTQIEAQKDKTYRFSFLLSLLPNIDLPEELFENFNTPRYLPEPPETDIERYWKNFLISVLAQRKQIPEHEQIDVQKDFEIQATLQTASGEEKNLSLKLQETDAIKEEVLQQLQGIRSGEELPLNREELLTLTSHIDKVPVRFMRQEDLNEIFAEGFKVVFKKSLYLEEEDVKPTAEEYENHFGKEEGIGSKEEALAFIRKQILKNMGDDEQIKEMFYYQFMTYLNEKTGSQIPLPEAYVDLHTKLNPERKLEEPHHKYSTLTSLLKKRLGVKTNQKLVEERLLRKIGLSHLPAEQREAVLKKLYEDASFEALRNLTYEEVDRLQLAEALEEKLQPKQQIIPFEEFKERYASSMKQAKEVFSSAPEEEE